MELFSDLKSLVTSLPVWVHDDINKTVVSVGASYDIESVLLQNVNDKLYPIAFASCFVTPSEQQYAQIENKILALT